MKLRRPLALICCLCAVLGCGCSALAATAALERALRTPRAALRCYFQSLDEYECAAFLEANGVEIPYFYVDDEGCPHIRDIILKYVKNPNLVPMMGLAQAHKFETAVKEMVRDMLKNYTFEDLPRPFFLNDRLL